MTNFVAISMYIDRWLDLEYHCLDKAYRTAYASEQRTGKRASLTRKFNAEREKIITRLRREWWLKIKADTTFKHHIELGELNLTVLVECVGWLKEQPFTGHVGVSQEMADALRHVVRDKRGEWRASRRKEAHWWLTWATRNASVFFSHGPDAVLFKTTFA